MATLWNNFALPLGGFLIAIFVGRTWGVKHALAEIERQDTWLTGRALWSFLIRWVCPVAIAMIIVYTVMSM